MSEWPTSTDSDGRTEGSVIAGGSVSRAPTRRARLIHALRWAVALVAIGVFVAYLLGNLDALRDEPLRLRPGYATAALGVLVAHLVGRALLWHLLTRDLDVAIGWRQALASWSVSLLGKYVPGKVFYLLARLEPYRREGRSKSQVTVAFGIETVAALIAQLGTVLVALWLADLGPLQPARPFLPLLLIVMAVGLHPRIIEPTLNLGLRLLRRPPTRIVLTYCQLLRVVGAYLINWQMFGLGFFLLLNSVYPVPIEDVAFVVGAMSVATVAGILALVVPSGLGVREGLLALLLAAIIPAPVAALVALAQRGWVLIGEGLVVVVTLGWQRSLLPPLSDDAQQPPGTAPASYPESVDTTNER